MRMFPVLFLLIVNVSSACAQTNIRMDFENYEPVSTLVVSEHKVTRAKYPFIDVHNHQWEMNGSKLKNLATDMDKINMKVMVNLSGVGGDKLKGFVDDIRSNYPNR